MYAGTKVGTKKLQAMVSTGADIVYTAKELADEIILPYKKEKGYIKGVNAKSLLIDGVGNVVDIRIWPWKGEVNITIASLDDRKFYPRKDFLDRAMVFIIPYVITVFITGDGQVHAISMR